jgi:gliding motility-associated lipoprotein GldH
MIRLKHLVVVSSLLICSFLSGCITNNIADVNVSMPGHRWSYINKITTPVVIKDHTKTYDLLFKLRHTAAYSYSNIYILFHFKAPGKKTITRRYGYKVATADGRFIGAGSGDLFSSTLPLLRNFKFPAPGTYTLEVEQCMLDNPLHNISDVGIMVVQND